MSVNRVIFYISEDVHMLDLAGVVQAFYESGYYGHPYEMIYVSEKESPLSSAHLRFTGLIHYSELEIDPHDIIMVPGYDLRQLETPGSSLFYQWLNDACNMGVTLCSVCTGCFTFAEAGLLNGKECTTHWKYTKRLQANYPLLLVKTNCLFVKSGNIYTSAGVTTGVDMALFLLEERHGPEFAFRVARELVVYIRRDGEQPQESVYLRYRQHINADIHAVQDHIIQNLHKKVSIEALAALVYMSQRSLTRLFKATTGATIGQYIEKLRVEKAVQLLREEEKVSTITLKCGLQSPNQLRHLVRKHTGRLPSSLRAL